MFIAALFTIAQMGNSPSVQEQITGLRNNGKVFGFKKR